jgi:hypothetical protein
MKKTILSVIVLLLFQTLLKAQQNAILFTENGERFTAILNGLRQNDKPQTNIKITGLNATYFKLKIIFEDKKLGERNFNLGLQENMETTVNIKRNSKGEFVLRPVSAVPLAQAPPSRDNQQVVIYNPNAPVYSETVTQSTTTTNSPDGVNMGVNVNADGTSFNMNVSDNSSYNSNRTTTTTTTTTTQSMYTDNPPPPAYVPGYNGTIGCAVPASRNQFEDMKRSVESKSFEDSKLTIAKQIVNNNCLLCSQVKEIILLFSFEATRLDFAKYCYGYTYDTGNYYKINDAFTFESSIDELNEYINSYHR